jgi:phosphoesterase RecJ-like protein
MNYDEILEKIKSVKHIVLIAHKNPDADSVGSASALYTLLMRLEKKVSLYCVTEKRNPHIEFIPWVDKIRTTFPNKAELAISFDCGAKSRLGLDVAIELINFDHHVSNDFYGMLNCIDVKAVSTTQVMYDFFNYHDIKINAKMATALYAGLIDDTNNFSNANCNSNTFDMARKLLMAQADKALCIQHLFQTNSLASLRLKGLIFNTLELHHSARIILLKVTREMIESSGALEVDCEAPLEESLHLSSVEVALLIRENRDGTIKGSLRSKSSSFNMNTIASNFGGGGHIKASGFEVKDRTIDDVCENMITILKEEMK